MLNTWKLYLVTLIRTMNLDYSLVFFLPSNDILGGLPHIVTGIIVNFTGIIVNFTESPIQKI